MYIYIYIRRDAAIAGPLYRVQPVIWGAPNKVNTAWTSKMDSKIRSHRGFFEGLFEGTMFYARDLQ